MLGAETANFNEPDNVETRKKLQECIYEAMLYKAGTVEMGFCGMCCKRDFSKIGVEQALKFVSRLGTSLKVFLVIDTILALGVVLYIASGGSSNGLVFLILSCISFVVSLIVIYLLMVAHRYSKNLLNKEDPFSNSRIMLMIILFVVTLRSVFAIALCSIADSTNKVDDERNVLIRCAITAIMMLFVIIPIRHNFEVHRIEA
mmetsp:Transcript_64592/g.89333  ORF Transcript_64592/g.89333 Transcript_64592/m.89333 type:complete len:202 (+) Transcript_64592:583-1188(+)